MTSTRIYENPELGIRFEIDSAFAAITPGCSPGDPSCEPPTLPAAHFIAAHPAAGWIAALAIVTVEGSREPPDEWLAGQVARAEASFDEWPPEAADILTPPEASELAGRPALHVGYRLRGAEAAAEAADADARAKAAVDGDVAVVPPSHVEHWAVLVEERGWVLAMELMVQPPERWGSDRAALDLPFRTLMLLGE